MPQQICSILNGWVRKRTFEVLRFACDSSVHRQHQVTDRIKRHVCRIAQKPIDSTWMNSQPLGNRLLRNLLLTLKIKE